ncbi:MULTISPECIES: molybdopterin-dependent oxidoreductase [unclassified Sedimentibacter]|uniref:molybdopterin-dependent oxidoreductase n=1 Tax=unclassified Sedimentibacter TaxID=2649220 RepID=UPI0027E0ED1B|nr:molybdopterin-dependent oxidoreductase [Sedimentibacter sp. MB35-C1]WMJ78261.1 molybdopterin-dependent oxidoreductase [Sedimentibacter sp. MB35-C1]
MRPDINNAEYILYEGAFPGHSGKPMQTIARQIKFGVNEGSLKYSVVDPVLVGGAVTPLYKKGEWVPIKPATDNAFGMALIRWIIENERYNKKFLCSPNYDAAVSKGFNSWTNAAHLVIDDPEHPNYRKMLRAEDLGMETGKDEKDIFIVIDNLTKQHDRFDKVSEADLFFEGKVAAADGKEIQVKTSFLHLKDSAFSHTIKEYSNACGVPEEKIKEIANEFTSHGTKVAMDGMGSTATANGADITMISYILMSMAGSLNKKGGAIIRRNSYKSASDGPRYRVSVIPDAPKKSGIRISRTGVSYESTSEYKNKVANGENPYPSKMPWHPVGSASDNQAVFSIVNKYPYQAKIVFNWMANPLLAVPAAAKKEVLEALKSTDNVPLFISCDPYMGEMTALADYIIPDTTPYESWGLANIEGNFSGKGLTLRWPIVEPATPKLPDGRHTSFETFIIDVAKKINLPGFGDRAMFDANDNLLPLNSREDYFVRGIANMAYDGEPVSDISKDEMDMQDLENAMKDWKNSVTEEEWPKVLKVISRGGRFEDHGAGFDGDNHKYPYKGAVNFYVESFANGINSMTGEHYRGVAAWNPESFSDGTLIADTFPESQWPFKAANYKPKFRSISMLSNSSIMRDLSKHNYVELNSEDAASLGIRTMDLVKVVPATGGDFTGYALVREGIAKGTIGIAYGYGHWEYGSKEYSIDGKPNGGNKDLGAGVHLMNILDPKVNGLFGISESSTGGPGRNGGAYRIEKV